MDDWTERSREAGRLAAQVGSAAADARLLQLLAEDEDTAVSQAAAEAVLARGDVEGLRLFAMAFGRVEEPERAKLGDCLYDEEGTRWGRIEVQLGPLLEDPDEAAAQGARTLQAFMHEESRRHRR